jgi:hypothetical protein
MMTIAALVGFVQFGLQYVGIANVDWVAQVLPKQFLVQGFAQNATIAYGADLRRSNAFLFLEPSFLSLFLGMAVIVAVRTGSGWFRLTILLAGMVPTLAGNGIVLLLPGLVITLFSPLRRNLLSVVPGVVAAVAAAALTPLGSGYLSRTTEAGTTGSSSSLRFVLPYSSLLKAAVDGPFFTLFGHGAGTADTFLDVRGLGQITRPIVPKVVFEYGTLGAIGIILVILVLFSVRLRGRVWMFGLLPAYFIINASFLQAELALFTIFWLTTLPPGADIAVRRPRLALWDRLVGRPPGSDALALSKDLT